MGCSHVGAVHAWGGAVNFVEFVAKLFRGKLTLPALGVSMFDPATTALLRAVSDEVCEDVSRHETAARTLR